MEEELDRSMTPKLIGDTYMKYPTEISQQRYRYGLYECQYCGKEFEATTAHIKSGNTKSCGCQKGGNTHGLSHNQFYKTWKSMMGRCTNPNNRAYKNYGARGITICDEWLDVRNFITWCESTYIKGMTMDRIDNDKGYSPENCTWSDKTTQVLNRRIMKNNKSGVVGVSYKIRDGVWVASIGVNNTRKHIGSFKTKEEAALARDNYIIENNLPHKLSTGYKRGESL